MMYNSLKFLAYIVLISQKTAIFTMLRRYIMKTRIMGILSGMLAAVLVFAAFIDAPVNVEAAESTFSGTVSDKTTADILYLVTSGGTMQFKIDSGTDLSTARFLLPGYKVTVTGSVGSDEYWHATRVSGSAVAGAAAVDSSKQYTVSGKVEKGTNEEMLHLSTSDGKMEIKIDQSTDVSNVRMFVIGRSLQVVCSRGSDAYMHAISISDSAAQTNSTAIAAVAAAATDTIQAQAPQTAAQQPVQTPEASSTTTVMGTVEKATTASVLCLDTSGGKMQFKIDSNAVANCRALIPGQTVTAAYYRGADEWNHVSSLTNNSSKKADTTSLEGSQLTVAGTVGSNTTEGTLYLVTSGGTMQIRMDAGTDFSACSVLVSGRKVQVVCQRGGDEYYHPVSISAQ